MGVKYECPKCGRRFAEWGAERLGFKCPHDEHCPADAPDDLELVRAGSQDEKTPKKPPLRRAMTQKAMERTAKAEEEEFTELSEGSAGGDDEFDGDDEEEEGAEEETDDEAPLPPSTDDDDGDDDDSPAAAGEETDSADSDLEPGGPDDGEEKKDW